MLRVFCLSFIFLLITPYSSFARSSSAKVGQKKSRRQLERQAKFRECMAGVEHDESVTKPIESESEAIVEAPATPKESELDYFRALGWSIKKDTGYVNKEAFPVTLVEMEKYGGYPVEIKTALAFDKMARSARKKGIHLTLNSGFRTQEQQIKLRTEWCLHRRAAIAAAAGRSIHQAGYALDINVREKSALRWINKHGHAFHFYRTVCSEPWHWEYSPTGEPLPMRYSCISKSTRIRIQKNHRRVNIRPNKQLVQEQSRNKVVKKTT